MVATPRSWGRSGLGVAVTVVVVLALVAVGALAWRAFGPERSYSASTRSTPQHASDPAAAAAALADLVTAVRDRDASSDSPMISAVVANAEALDVVDFTARYIEQTTVDADGRWTADVALSWRFEGFDESPVSEEVQVGFQDAGSPSAPAEITGFGGGQDRTPLWLSGPLQVRRGDGNLVLASTAAEADLLAQRAQQAVVVVRRVLPSWTGGLVVEAPASEDELDAMLGADPGTYSAIAAVSASVDGTTTTRSPVHVFVNPTVYDALDPIGGQVVLSHEATHVATDAPVTAGLPTWLLEGFADYVALRDVDLPLSTTAGQIQAQVRASGVPDHLPDGTDFDEHATHLGASYEAAWLVCRVLADVHGEAALVRFYRQVSAGKPLAAQLRSQFGLSEQQLLVRWQQRLTRLAAGSVSSS